MKSIYLKMSLQRVPLFKASILPPPAPLLIVPICFAAVQIQHVLLYDSLRFVSRIELTRELAEQRSSGQEIVQAYRV
jgi:hypothetical protein